MINDYNRQKKQTLRKRDKFRILRVGAVRGYCPRAKDGKRQKWQGLDVLAIFPIPPSATSCTHLPLQGRQKGLFSIIGRGLAALSKSD